MSEVKVKDKDHLVRETYSKAIISTDFDAYERSRKIRTKKNGEGGKMRKYFKRLWCALWNKKCHDDCDCV